MDQLQKTKQVAIVTIHGMGHEEPTYYQGFEEKLKKKLRDRWDQVAFGHIDYQDLLERNEKFVYERMQAAKTRFDSFILWRKLREFLIFYLADPTSLETNVSAYMSSYYQAQDRIAKTLHDIYTQADQNKELKLFIVAHSLGGQVISNYIWDAQFSESAARLEAARTSLSASRTSLKKQKAPSILPDNRTTRVGVWGEAGKFDAYSNDEIEFLLLRNLYRFYTCGCNIPLFTAGHDHIVPFKRPNADFRWFNFYSRNDVLGWPLEPLIGRAGPVDPRYDGHPCYEELVEDTEIHVGKWWQFWNPFAHTAYFTDDKFIDPIVDEVKKLIPEQPPIRETTSLYSASNP